MPFSSSPSLLGLFFDWRSIGDGDDIGGADDHDREGSRSITLWPALQLCGGGVKAPRNTCVRHSRPGEVTGLAAGDHRVMLYELQKVKAIIEPRNNSSYINPISLWVDTFFGTILRAAPPEYTRQLCFIPEAWNLKATLVTCIRVGNDDGTLSPRDMFDLMAPITLKMLEIRLIRYIKYHF